MNNPQALLLDPAFFQLDSEFHAHVLATLNGDAPGALAMLDATGSLFQLGSSATCDALAVWLVARGATLRLITFDATHVFQNCQRFIQLRDRFGPTLVDWRVAPPEQARHVQQATVATPFTLIRKPVRDAHHGYITRDREEIAGQRDYFEQIWQHCEPASPTTPLGL